MNSRLRFRVAPCENVAAFLPVRCSLAILPIVPQPGLDLVKAFNDFTTDKDLGAFQAAVNRIFARKGKEFSEKWTDQFDPVTNKWAHGTDSLKEFGNPHPHQFITSLPFKIPNQPATAPQILISSTVPMDMVDGAKEEAERFPKKDFLEDRERLNFAQKLTGFQPSIVNKEVRTFIKRVVRQPANVTANLDLIRSQNPQLHKGIINEITEYFSPIADYIPGFAIKSWASKRSSQYYSAERFKHHQAKSGKSLAESHFAQMQLLDPNASKARTTEVRGEFATTAGILHFLSVKYQFKEGFVNKGHQGIDQIWVERNANTGEVKSYLIAEAKGSEGATLGQTRTKGEQMSPFWVLTNLAQLYGRGDERQQGLATKIVEAIAGKKTYLSIKAERARGVQKPDIHQTGIKKDVAVKGIVVWALPMSGILEVIRVNDYSV